MKAIRDFYTKEEIQSVYNFLCYSLKRTFNSIAIDSDNNVYANNHVQKFLNKKNIPLIKKELSRPIKDGDYEIILETVVKKDTKLYLMPLLFYMNEAIFNQFLIIKDKNIIDVINQFNIIKFIHQSNDDTFLNAINNNMININNIIAFWDKLCLENHTELQTKVRWFSFLRQNQKADLLPVSTEVSAKLRHFKNKFQFKNVIITPGNCSDIVKGLDFCEQELDIIVKTLGIPQGAIGLNIMNASLCFETDTKRLSLTGQINYGYFTYYRSHYNLYANVYHDSFKTTFIHEYAHFLSSLIYLCSAERKTGYSNSIYKWDDDNKNQDSILKNAHSLKLDWIAKTVNLSNWEDFTYLRNNTPANNGHQYLEINFTRKLIDGIDTHLSDGFLNSDLVISNMTNGNDIVDMRSYLHNIFYKLYEYKILKEEQEIPQKNINEAVFFFLKESCYIRYKNNVKNPYLKSLMQFSGVDSSVLYSSNTEEIWARCFEALINVEKTKEIDYSSFKDKDFNINDAYDEMYKPDIHLNSADRLHILYIIKNVIATYMPDAHFIPEDAMCYKEFKNNNPDENSELFIHSQTILEHALKTANA